MQAWWTAWQEGFAGFAWPWAWAFLPLPVLVRLLLPPRPSPASALRVPWGRRLEGVGLAAAAGQPCEVQRGRHQRLPGPGGRVQDDVVASNRARIASSCAGYSCRPRVAT